MKIYTRKGDEGMTSLLGGVRVPKHHLRIECYGTIDELNSYIGVLRDHEPANQDGEFLQWVQDTLFTIGSHLATDPTASSKLKLPEIKQADVDKLEQSMDQFDEELPALKNFVLPGGHPANSFTHVARCVCRRAERLAVQLNEEETVEPIILRFLNRLRLALYLQPLDVVSKWQS